MTESALLKKMKLKPGTRVAVVGAPDSYLKTLKPIPAKATIDGRRVQNGVGYNGSPRILSDVPQGSQLRETPPPAA